MRVLLYWLTISFVIGSAYYLVRGVDQYMKRDRIEPENHDELVERMSLLRQREAGNEVER